jgi:hypothetical protein
MRGLILFSIAFTVVVAAGLSDSASAQTDLSANGASIVLPYAPSPAINLHASKDVPRVSNLGKWLGVQDGRLDVFSVKPVGVPGFAPTLHGGFGGEGLQLQMKW